MSTDLDLGRLACFSSNSNSNSNSGQFVNNKTFTYVLIDVESMTREGNAREEG